MSQYFSKKEEEFFKKHRGQSSKVKVILIGTAFLLFIGLLIDAFNGFYILRYSKSIFFGIGGLFLLSIFYLLGEAEAGWIGSKDDVSHPLYKRVLHLFLLLLFTGAVITSFWFIFKHFIL
jgi:hypothetical protein